MTRVRRHRWTLMMAALALLAAGPVPALSGGSVADLSGGPVAELSGSGPVNFGSMLTCGYCVGLGIGMLYSDTWAAFLAKPTSWKYLGICGAACVAVFES